MANHASRPPKVFGSQQPVQPKNTGVAQGQVQQWEDLSHILPEGGVQAGFQLRHERGQEPGSGSVHLTGPGGKWLARVAYTGKGTDKPQWVFHVGDQMEKQPRVHTPVVNHLARALGHVFQPRGQFQNLLDEAWSSELDGAESMFKAEGKKRGGTWAGRPILDAEDAHGLEAEAALREFRDRRPRAEAEEDAHRQYRHGHHQKAAAHHLRGMKMAQASGQTEEAHKHSVMYALHLQQLGHDPYKEPPPEVRSLLSKEPDQKQYRYKDHGGDGFLLEKGEDLAPALVLKKAWPRDEHENQANQAGFMNDPVAQDHAMESGAEFQEMNDQDVLRQVGAGMQHLYMGTVPTDKGLIEVKGPVHERNRQQATGSQEARDANIQYDHERGWPASTRGSAGAVIREKEPATQSAWHPEAPNIGRGPDLTAERGFWSRIGKAAGLKKAWPANEAENQANAAAGAVAEDSMLERGATRQEITPDQNHAKVKQSFSAASDGVPSENLERAGLAEEANWGQDHAPESQPSNEDRLAQFQSYTYQPEDFVQSRNCDNCGTATPKFYVGWSDGEKGVLCPDCLEGDPFGWDPEDAVSEPADPDSGRYSGLPTVQNTGSGMDRYGERTFWHNLARSIGLKKTELKKASKNVRANRNNLTPGQIFQRLTQYANRQGFTTAENRGIGPASIIAGKITSNERQPITHELGHAFMTPEGQTAGEYTRQLARDGSLPKDRDMDEDWEVEQEQRDARDAADLDEDVASVMEAGIARRAGVAPHAVATSYTPNPHKNPVYTSVSEYDDRDPKAVHADLQEEARHHLNQVDTGQKTFKRGRAQAGTSVNARINARAENPQHGIKKQEDRTGVVAAPKAPEPTKTGVSIHQPGGGLSSTRLSAATMAGPNPGMPKPGIPKITPQKAGPGGLVPPPAPAGAPAPVKPHPLDLGPGMAGHPRQISAPAIRPVLPESHPSWNTWKSEQGELWKRLVKAWPRNEAENQENRKGFVRESPPTEDALQEQGLSNKQVLRPTELLTPRDTAKDKYLGAYMNREQRDNLDRQFQVSRTNVDQNTAQNRELPENYRSGAPRGLSYTDRQRVYEQKRPFWQERSDAEHLENDWATNWGAKNRGADPEQDREMGEAQAALGAKNRSLGTPDAATATGFENAFWKLLQLRVNTLAAKPRLMNGRAVIKPRAIPSDIGAKMDEAVFKKAWPKDEAENQANAATHAVMEDSMLERGAARREISPKEVSLRLRGAVNMNAGVLPNDRGLTGEPWLNPNTSSSEPRVQETIGRKWDAARANAHQNDVEAGKPRPTLPIPHSPGPHRLHMSPEEPVGPKGGGRNEKSFWNRIGRAVGLQKAWPKNDAENKANAGAHQVMEDSMLEHGAQRQERDSDDVAPEVGNHFLNSTMASGDMQEFDRPRYDRIMDAADANWARNQKQDFSKGPDRYLDGEGWVGEPSSPYAQGIAAWGRGPDGQEMNQEFSRYGERAFWHRLGRAVGINPMTPMVKAWPQKIARKDKGGTNPMKDPAAAATHQVLQDSIQERGDVKEVKPRSMHERVAQEFRNEGHVGAYDVGTAMGELPLDRAPTRAEAEETGDWDDEFDGPPSDDIVADRMSDYAENAQPDNAEELAGRVGVEGLANPPRKSQRPRVNAVGQLEGAGTRYPRVVSAGLEHYQQGAYDAGEEHHLWSSLRNELKKVKARKPVKKAWPKDEKENAANAASHQVMEDAILEQGGKRHERSPEGVADSVRARGEAPWMGSVHGPPSLRPDSATVTDWQARRDGTAAAQDFNVQQDMERDPEAAVMEGWEPGRNEPVGLGPWHRPFRPANVYPTPTPDADPRPTADEFAEKRFWSRLGRLAGLNKALKKALPRTQKENKANADANAVVQDHLMEQGRVMAEPGQLAPIKRPENLRQGVADDLSAGPYPVGPHIGREDVRPPTSDRDASGGWTNQGDSSIARRMEHEYWSGVDAAAASGVKALFRPGDKVQHVNQEGYQGWVGTVKYSPQEWEDEEGNIHPHHPRGPTWRDHDFDGPGHYYEVYWTTPRGERHADYLHQDNLHPLGGQKPHKLLKP